MSQPLQESSVLIVWENPLFRETLRAVLVDAGFRYAVAPMMAAMPQRPSPSVKTVIIEGDREQGQHFLQTYAAGGEVDILALRMDDDRAHLFGYRMWRNVSREDVLRFLTGSESTSHIRTQE